MRTCPSSAFERILFLLRLQRLVSRNTKTVPLTTFGHSDHPSPIVPSPMYCVPSKQAKNTSTEPLLTQRLINGLVNWR